MIIRNATIDDLAAVAAVERECFPAAEAATEAQLAERLKYYGNHFWLMVDRAGEGTAQGAGISGPAPGAEDRVVAFVDGFVTNEPNLTDEMYEQASMHQEDGKWQMIFGVNTIPSYRKRGLAGQLIERAIADSRSQGRLGLVLTCKDRLIHYYAKFGFVWEGVSESVHGNVVWNQMRLTF